jgi:hypothetical protein
MQLEIDDYENKLLYDIIGDHIGIEKEFNVELRNSDSPDDEIPLKQSNTRLHVLTMLRARL